MASNEACMIAFSDQLKAAINDEGQLYDIIKATNPDTPITGLGNPGKGIEYTGGEEETDVDRSQGSDGGGGDGDDDSGLPVWAIVLIALAGLLILLAIIALYVRHKKRNRVEEFPGEQAQEDDMIDDKEPDLAPTAPMEEIKEEPAPEEEPAPDAAPEDDDESSAPSDFSESADVSNVDSSTMVDDNKEPALSAGSALAAMGAAGAAVALAGSEKQKG